MRNRKIVVLVFVMAITLLFFYQFFGDSLKITSKAYQKKENKKSEYKKILMAVQNEDLAYLNEYYKAHGRFIVAPSTKQHPIHFAARINKISVLKFFIDNVDRYKARDSLGNNALLISCRYGDFETVKYLLSNGFSLDDMNVKAESCLDVSKRDNRVLYKQLLKLENMN